ncbi:hypothetical protein DPEC_G00079990 [Dallia pectoralis]|uniref:Uncharacterized protein n=1 Tax=Dallia pectoralis TaxID=75939 RepID=A0ACC2H4J1_DALPE|nr:hypothetical protein DPEC_G00079990 [Dallia pectoralis]
MHHEDGIINGAKLPTGCQMLRCMLAIKPGANGVLSQFDAAMVVLEQVWQFYMKANIPMAKCSNETTAKQLETMECRLDATFPLWPPNVEKLIDNPEDLAFLASMKTDRVATFGVLDIKLQLKSQAVNVHISLHLTQQLTEQKDQVLETISEEQHKQWTPPPLCTLHWDSKLTPMLSIRPC